jgi:hypothetical protein
LEHELPFDGFCSGGFVVGDGGGDAAAEDPHRVLIGTLDEVPSSVAIAISNAISNAIAGTRLGMLLPGAVDGRRRRELGLGREEARDEFSDEPGDVLALHCRDLASLSPQLLLIPLLSFSFAFSFSFSLSLSPSLSPSPSLYLRRSAAAAIAAPASEV